jgi:hypothetical protein
MLFLTGLTKISLALKSQSWQDAGQLRTDTDSTPDFVAA